MVFPFVPLTRISTRSATPGLSIRLLTTLKIEIVLINVPYFDGRFLSNADALFHYEPDQFFSVYQDDSFLEIVGDCFCRLVEFGGGNEHAFAYSFGVNRSHEIPEIASAHYFLSIISLP